MTLHWPTVWRILEGLTRRHTLWKDGQERSLRWIARRLRQTEQRGVVIADEVGMGKTRVALAAVHAVLESGGSAAVVVPPGLLFQWRQEWDRFQDSLGWHRRAPVELRGFASLFTSPQASFPCCRPGTLIILSHRFSLPAIYENARPNRYRLPLLVQAAALARSGKLRRKSWSPLRRELRRQWFDHCARHGPECSGCLYDDTCRVKAEWTAANFLAKRTHVDPVDLGTDWYHHPGRARSWLLDQDSPGRAMYEDLVARLLGRPDLLVVDEAHKARDDADDPTQLGRLLRRLLRIQPDGRRLALTATPVELHAQQWGHVLDRAGLVMPRAEIERFDFAHRQVREAPDRRATVAELCQAAEGYQRSLNPLVTRRRRRDHLQQFITGSEARAHPHRAIERWLITYDDPGMSERWQGSLLAYEALGLAAKGLGQEARKLKVADSRYASGSLDLAHLGLEMRPEDYTDPALAARCRRAQHWRQYILRSQAADDQEDHPRLRHAADLIERLAWADQEKVLVFGTYLRPLRALTRILNHRSALRLLDLGCVLPGRYDIRSLVREFSQLRREGKHPPFTGALRRLDQSQLPERIRAGIRGYTRSRQRLERILNVQYLRSLPGDAAINQLPDEQRSQLLQLLRTRVIERSLVPGSATATNAPAPEETRNLARAIWCEYLESARDEGQDEAPSGPQTRWRGGAIAGRSLADTTRLDAWADQLDPREITAILAEEGDLLRGSSFARLLSGEVQMRTRRVLQAQFNDKHAYPRVLLAQSQVGREGLNLHCACRHVVLFHPEWNPAVIEQQIGRVDRIGSHWEALARAWKVTRRGEMPRIHVHHVIFEGTYDDRQSSILRRRHDLLMAQLYGELIDEETALRMPGPLRKLLAGRAPDFSPPK